MWRKTETQTSLSNENIIDLHKNRKWYRKIHYTTRFSSEQRHMVVVASTDQETTHFIRSHK